MTPLARRPASSARCLGDDFRIVRLLNEGGMGEVFIAEQISTGAMRALKMMHEIGRIASVSRSCYFSRRRRRGVRAPGRHEATVT